MGRIHSQTIKKDNSTMNQLAIVLISILVISTISATPIRQSCGNKSKTIDDSVEIKQRKNDNVVIDSFPSERADYLVEDILFLNPLSALEEAEENTGTEDDSDYISDEDVIFADLNRHKLVLTEEEIKQELNKQKT